MKSNSEHMMERKFAKTGSLTSPGNTEPQLASTTASNDICVKKGETEAAEVAGLMSRK